MIFSYAAIAYNITNLQKTPASAARQVAVAVAIGGWLGPSIDLGWEARSKMTFDLLDLWASRLQWVVFTSIQEPRTGFEKFQTETLSLTSAAVAAFARALIWIFVSETKPADDPD